MWCYHPDISLDQNCTVEPHRPIYTEIHESNFKLGADLLYILSAHNYLYCYLKKAFLHLKRNLSLNVHQPLFSSFFSHSFSPQLNDWHLKRGVKSKQPWIPLILNHWWQLHQFSMLMLSWKFGQATARATPGQGLCKINTQWKMI